ncbi:MAG: type II secretion system F family protein [Myxococcota bacterium]
MTGWGSWLGYAGAVLLAAGLVSSGALWVADPDGLPARWWGRYEANLARDARLLMLGVGGRSIALAHVAGLGVWLAVAVLARATWMVFVVPVLLVGPVFWLSRRREKKVAEIELQLDAWLVVLGNALKSNPSLGEALESSVRLTGSPLREELDLALKEVQLGTPLDLALHEMAARIGSRMLDSTLSGLLVARKTGGDLPRMLDRTAATLREMQRLEGVVRTKTAEGKSQAYVLAVMPFGLLGILHVMDPEFLGPLVESPIGWGVTFVAFLCWAGSIAMARKILAVDV